MTDPAGRKEWVKSVNVQFFAEGRTGSLPAQDLHRLWEEQPLAEWSGCF